MSIRVRRAAHKGSNAVVRNDAPEHTRHSQLRHTRDTGPHEAPNPNCRRAPIQRLPPPNPHTQTHPAPSLAPTSALDGRRPASTSREPLAELNHTQLQPHMRHHTPYLASHKQGTVLRETAQAKQLAPVCSANRRPLLALWLVQCRSELVQLGLQLGDGLAIPL